MKYQEPTPDDYLHIAEKVRSGEYFRESRSMYNIFVNDPMSERYFYIFVTFLALLTFLCAFFAMQSLYPLSRTVPFTYALNDVIEDVPSISPLRSSPSQSVDQAVLFFLAKTFVQQYESYDILTLEKNYSGIEHAASPEVFAGYQRMLQTSNPDSPVIKYQRHSVRNINVVHVMQLDSPANTVEVMYDASVENAEGARRARFQARLGYTFSGVEFDAEADKVKPVNFTVTSYSTKLLQDIP